MERQVLLGAESAKLIKVSAISRRVQLCSNNDHGLFAERGAKGDQFAINDVVRVYGIGVGKIAGVD